MCKDLGGHGMGLLTELIGITEKRLSSFALDMIQS